MLSRTLRVASGIAMCAASAVAFSLTSCGGGGGSGKAVPGLVTLTTDSAPNGTTGVAYTAQFEAFIPHPPGTFVLAGGALPTGLTLDHNTGVISGYPRQVGVFHFTIAARDGTDADLPPNRDANFSQDARDFVVNIALGPPHILPQQPPAATYRQSYGYQIDVAGGTQPYTFSGPPAQAGTLPAGLTVSSTGLLGTFPTEANALPYNFDVQV